MRDIKEKFPNTVWTVSRLNNYRKRMYFGAYVPDWLHRLLSSLPVDADPRDPATFENIKQQVSQIAGPRFASPGFVEFVSVVWLALCINPSRANDRFHVCSFKTECYFRGYWTLNPNQIIHYLDFVAMREGGASDINTRFTFNFDEITSSPTTFSGHDVFPIFFCVVLECYFDERDSIYNRIYVYKQTLILNSLRFLYMHFRDMRLFVFIGIYNGVVGSSSSTDPLIEMGELVSSESSMGLDAWLDTQDVDEMTPGSWTGDKQPLPALSKPWTEELVFLSHLRRDGPLSPMDILRRIKLHIPSSSWTEARVEARMNVLKSSLVAPQGLHQELDRIFLGCDSYLDKQGKYIDSIRPFVRHLIPGVRFSFQPLLDSWTTHCIEKYHQWTLGQLEYEPCKPVTLMINEDDAVTVWTLTPAGIREYLTEMERNEIERITGTSVIPPVRTAVQTPPVINSRKRMRSSNRCMSALNKLKCFVLVALIKNANHAYLTLFVTSYLPGVSHADIAQEKENIMKFTRMPSVVHNGMRSAEMVPSNDHMHAWLKYCVEPLSIRKKSSRLPCYNVGQEWKLSRSAIDLYMKDLLDSLF